MSNDAREQRLRFVRFDEATGKWVTVFAVTDHGMASELDLRRCGTCGSTYSHGS